MNLIEEKCQKKGVRLTDQRKTIAKVKDMISASERDEAKLKNK